MTLEGASATSGSDVNARWREDAPLAIKLPSLAGDCETDIAIVGGGIAGLSVAYHLTTHGINPVVLETAEIGEQATGRSGGIIASLPARHSPREMIEKYGDKRGKQLVSLFGESGQYTWSLIADLKLNCSMQPKGFIAPAMPGKKLQRLREVSTQWQYFGHDIQYLDGQSTARLSGLECYGGALLDPNGGSVNPLAFAREMARVSAEKGATIYVHSRVQSTSRIGGKWQLQTAAGKVIANKVIFCAGGENRGLHRALRKSVLPLKVLEFSTEPLSADKRRVLLPGGHALTDTHPDIFTIRYDGDGRIITGCTAFLCSNNPQRAIAAMSKRLRNMSPLFEGVRIEDVWRGTAWLGPSFMPRVCDLSQGKYVVQACNGRGLALNTLLGLKVSECVVSGADSSHGLLSDRPDSIRPYFLASRAPALIANAARYRTLIKDMVKM